MLTVEWFLNFVNTYLVDFVVNLILAVIVLFVGLKTVKFIVTRLKKLKLVKKLDSNMGALFVNGMKVLLNALIIIVAIEILGVPSATVIAIIGSCGLAVGLALQGGLSNLAGGVMIMIFKPFHVGDYIRSKEGEGIVEEIGIFYTKLVTIDARNINIPNSILSSTTVNNLSAMEKRGIDIEVAVAYGTDIDLARHTLLACADANPLVLKDPMPKAFVSDHADSSVKLTLRVFVKTQEYFRVRAQLLEATIKALTRAGIEIPFQQVDVHMK